MDVLDHDLLDHAEQHVMRIFGQQRFFTQSINHFALFIHDVVIFQRPFTNREVMLFHPALGRFDRTVQPRML